MHPGVIALRGAITAAWEDDLRAVLQDGYDTGVGKEALVFIQRFYSLVSQLRTPIQRAWGMAGLVHVADNPDVTGPGQRVSQTRIKLRNHGDMVAVEAFTYSDGASKHNPSLGLDREIKVAGVGSFAFVQELYRTMVAFLETAALWWLYFDVAAIFARRRLTQAGGLERARVARDGYSYLHLPMIAGIHVVALLAIEIAKRRDPKADRRFARLVALIGVGALSFGAV